jgi:cytochrome oxidase assembly protein ShyY1
VRFLVSRRWALFAVTVVVLAYGCYLLGQWQFHRLHDREATNAQTRTNLAAPPAPVADVLTPDRPARQRDEWRRVVATGSYLADRSVVIRYQTRDGSSGVDVVTPLRTDAGPSLLVDRGWMSSQNLGGDKVRTPPPPAGRVRVVGWVRADATGDATRVVDGSARAISSVEIARSLGASATGPVYRGFVDAERESPAAEPRLVPAEVPDLGNGPHFFYGLQWWFFGVLAIFGFFYLAYDEWRNGPRGERLTRPQRQPRPKSKARLQAEAARRQIERERAERVAQSARTIPPSTGSITPETNDDAGESRKAATRPNSSGAP